MANWLNTPIQTQFRVIDGLSIRFAESEDRDDHALLLSPWPESLLAFEPVWSRLAERTHLVAIDLPGFGRSQRRDALLSPLAMGEFIIRAADAFDLDHPHAYPAELPALAGLLPQIQTPVRIIAGARSRCAVGQRPVPSRAAAPQQARHHRRRALHLGRRRRPVRCTRYQLVGRRLRGHRPCASTVILCNT